MKITCNYNEFPTSSTIGDGNEDLKFSTSQLIHAAYTVGKHNFEEVYAHPYHSEKEVNFRISMIQAFLSLENDYVIRSPIFYKLDPSEKGAVNYFLGMVFTNLIAQYKFHVKWLVHLDLFNGKLEFRDSKKKPDFVGESRKFSWMAFEAKGIQRKTDNTEKNALEQLENLVSIDGNIPLKVASILHGNVDEVLRLKLIDPDEKAKQIINLEGIDYATHYYAAIYYMIKKDFRIISVNNREFAIRDIECSHTEIGIDNIIFNKLDELEKRWIEGKRVRKETVELEEIVNRKHWITKSVKEYLDSIKETDPDDDYFIANDGIYVRYYGKKIG